MAQTLTIVTYHYVRDLRHSRFPDIKGRSVEDFDRQLDHMAVRYHFVRLEDVIACSNGMAELPDNAAVLSFDDGYLDHYTTVFPRLFERGIQGWFFPVVDAVRSRHMLAVNKVQFVLASVDDKQKLADDVLTFVCSLDDPRIDSAEAYRTRLATPGRWDPPEVMLVKRLLQQELPADVRSAVIDDMFRRYVSSDEAAFANELYVDEAQLRTMINCGMYVGSHGVSHSWMDHQEPQTQAAEVDQALAFLGELGASTKDWVFCYPYGRWNECLLATLTDRRCAFGLSTMSGLASVGVGGSDPLLLPRVDTNDIPAS